MDESILQEQIAAARAYEALFVPAVFGQFAPVVCQAAGVQPGQRVLDVACGTGVVAREAAVLVGPNGYVAGVDIAPGMLAVAQEIAPEIDWKQGSALSLPFPDGSFDVVASQFGFMFFPDKEQALREMQRVLTDEGKLAVVIWDSLANNPAYEDEAAIFQRIAGEAAAYAVRVPFLMGDTEELLELALLTGLTTAVVTDLSGEARFPSLRTMVEADLRGWLPVMDVNLEEDQIQAILSAAETEMSGYVNENNEAVFPVAAHLLSGSKEKT